MARSGSTFSYNLALAIWEGPRLAAGVGPPRTGLCIQRLGNNPGLRGAAPRVTVLSSIGTVSKSCQTSTDQKYHCPVEFYSRSSVTVLDVWPPTVRTRFTVPL